jgi:hypothetical protein
MLRNKINQFNIERRTKMAFETGPYIQAACFCNMVLEDKTGVLSLIRVIDTLTHTAQGPNPPDDMPPIHFEGKLVLMIKSGQAVGRHDLKIVPELPSGELHDPISMSVHFDGEEKGQNIVSNLKFVFAHEGLYWFNVYLDEAKLTAIPFRIRYNRVTTGPLT